MSGTTIPMSDAARVKLQDMASWLGRAPADVLERAVEEYYDRHFWEAVNAGYEAMRADPKAWAEEEAERRLWDRTLMDGLDPSERWSEDGTPLPPAEGKAS